MSRRILNAISSSEDYGSRGNGDSLAHTKPSTSLGQTAESSNSINLNCQSSTNVHVVNPEMPDILRGSGLNSVFKDISNCRIEVKVYVNSSDK